MPRKILFSAMKDEAPFLIEWLAYHRAIGFDDVHIAANASNDTTVELLQALDAAGEITFYLNEVAVGERPQGNAAKLFNSAKPWKSRDWVLWLDADEFLNVHLGKGMVDDLIAGLKGQDGMFLQWRIMGSSGYVGLPKRMLSQEMVGASAVTDKINREIKTLWQAGTKFDGFAEVALHRPRVAEGKKDAINIVTSDGTPMKAKLRVNEMWLDREDVGASNWATRRPVDWRLAQINHYAVRSRDALALKKRRGRGWEIMPEDGSNDRHNDAFLKSFDRNVRLDTSILRHLKATDAEMARLMALPKVADLHAAGVEMAHAVLDAKTAVERPELTLPEDAAALVKAELSKSKAYLEYGSGGSTVLASEMNVPTIYSVESDMDWADMMRRYLSQTERGLEGIHVHSAYIGATGDWARPKSEAGWRFYMRYSMSIWDTLGFEEPDLVLIDGRFRAGCFLATYLRHKKPLRILFDDYEERTAYHVIEQLVSPTKMAGRMAAFDLDPKKRDYDTAFGLLDVLLEPE